MDAVEAKTGAASCRYTTSLAQIELTAVGLAGVATGFGNAKAVKGRSATRSVDMYGDMVGDARDGILNESTSETTLGNRIHRHRTWTELYTITFDYQPRKVLEIADYETSALSDGFFSQKFVSSNERDSRLTFAPNSSASNIAIYPDRSYTSNLPQVRRLL